MAVTHGAVDGFEFRREGEFRVVAAAKRAVNCLVVVLYAADLCIPV